MGEVKIVEKKFLERVYPAAWNQYFYLAERLKRIDRQLEILLLISGVFFATYSYQAISSLHIFLPSLIGFAIIYIISLYCILPRVIHIPWIRNDTSHLEFETYKQNKDVQGFYNQLVTETYKFEFDLRYEFKRKKKFVFWVIIILIFSTFLPLSIILSEKSNLYSILVLFGIGILAYIFKKKFGTYLIDEKRYFKSGDKPGKGIYRCLYCRNNYSISSSQKLKICEKCNHYDYVKIEKSISQKVNKYEKFLMSLLIINLILLVVLDGLFWIILSFSLWIIIWILIIYWIALLPSFLIFKILIEKIFEYFKFKLKEKEKQKEELPRFYKYFKKCKKYITKKIIKMISILACGLLLAVIIIPVFPPFNEFIFPSYIQTMTNLKADANDQKLDDLVANLISNSETELNKTKALLRWFDENSENMHNSFMMSRSDSFIGELPGNILIFSEEPYFCIRSYENTNANWILTSRCGACGEYSRFFMEMAMKADIIVRRVRDPGEDHDWNEVKINSNWIPIDSTNVSLPFFEGIKSLNFMENKEGNVSFVYAEYPDDRPVEDITYRYTLLTNLSIKTVNEKMEPIENVNIAIFSNNLKRDPRREIKQKKGFSDKYGFYNLTIGGGNYTIIAQTKTGKYMANESTITFNDNYPYHKFELVLK